MNPEEPHDCCIPDQWRKMPLSAPVWVWLLYVVLISFLMWIGARDAFGGLLAPMLTAMFSFQFWTYASWRGLQRQHE